MASERNLFSDSWHRVRHLRIQLRPDLEVRKQVFRGELWYVLQDPFNNRFFRFRPEAYSFMAHLSAEKTVDEVWEQALQQQPDTAPGQPEVIRMLAQLYQASLLVSDIPPDSARLFERFRRQKQRELKSKLLSILFVRLPLFDPNRLLNKLQPLVNPLISVWGLLFWLVIVGLGLKTAFSHLDELTVRSSGILAPGNLPLLYLAFILVKLLHEAGHACITKKYGGEIHVAGVMLMVFNPIPYVDTTSAWAFRQRWKRVLVGSGGMIVELFIASLAVFAWSAIGEGVVRALLYNVMFVASVSTLLLNINPLMRFDGYYILSDLMDRPNLNQQANKFFLYICERYLYGNRQMTTPVRTRWDGFLLFSFAVASWCYRLFIVGVILWFVADQFFGLGFVAAMIGLFTFICVPILQHVRFLLHSPRIERIRTRAILTSTISVAVIVSFLAFVPMPNAFRSAGIVTAAEHRNVFASAPGYLSGEGKASNSPVQSGEPVFRMENAELSIELKSAEARLDQMQAVQTVAINDAEIAKTVEKRLVAIHQQIEKIQSEQAALDYQSSIDGIWVSPAMHTMQDAYLKRGTQLGIILQPGEYRFQAVVSQAHAAHLFNEEVTGGSFRIPGQAETEIELSELEFIQAEQHFLPHASLGWSAGGTIETDFSDPSGLRTIEPYFLLKAKIVLPEDQPITLYHNLSAIARFDLPPEPYFVQWFTYARRLIQQRFEI